MFQIRQAPRVLSSDSIPGAIPAPPGKDVPELVKELALDLPETLPKIGTLTPWALRSGDMRWSEVLQPAQLNFEVYGLSDAALAKIFRDHFSLELPYVAVLSKRAPMQAELERAFSGAPYEPDEVTAVYSQRDGSPVPEVYYLLWLRQRAPGWRGRGSTEKSAKAIGGLLVYACQVPVAGTTSRRLPVATFAEALQRQQVTRAIRAGGGQ
jgi:hypothetical protein